MKKSKQSTKTLVVLCTFLSIAFGLAVSCTTKDSPSNGWNQWRGPNRDGISLEKKLLKVWPVEGPVLAWSVDSIGEGFSSATVCGQTVFTTGKRDSLEMLTAINHNDGSVLWTGIVGRASKKKDWPQSRCTPTVYKGKVYASAISGDLTCFDCETGKIEWSKSVYDIYDGQEKDEATESPLVFDDKIIVTPCGEKTTMVALNRLNGEVIWETESIGDTASYASPVFIETPVRKAIFASTRNFDLLVDGNTGEIIMKEPHISGMVPQVMGNEIYFTGQYKQGGSLYKYSEDLSERNLVWNDTVSAFPIGGCVPYQNKILVSGFRKGIFCIDKVSGNVVSVYDDMNGCNFTLADDMIYTFENRKGNVGLFTMDADTLQMVSQFKINQGKGAQIAHLSISNGLLLVRRGEVLMAYQIKQL